MKNCNRPDLPVIGWREWIQLPDLGVNKIKAKVDTGARSSSLHVFNLQEFEDENRSYVRFMIHPIQRSTSETINAEAEVLEFRSVRSSSGKSAIRPVILTRVRLLDITWTIELTLAKRDKMGFRMLLGRQAFRNKFTVDAGNSFCNGKPKTKKQKFRAKKMSKGNPK